MNGHTQGNRAGKNPLTFPLSCVLLLNIGCEKKKYFRRFACREPLAGEKRRGREGKYILEPRTEPPVRRSRGAVRARYSAGHIELPSEALFLKKGQIEVVPREFRPLHVWQGAFFYRPYAGRRSYHRLTRGNTPDSGQKERCRRSRIWRALARLHPVAWSTLLLLRRQVLRSFSGGKIGAGQADEAAGLAPGNEDNAASAYFYPEKPCFPLLTDGTLVL